MNLTKFIQALTESEKERLKVLLGLEEKKEVVKLKPLEERREEFFNEVVKIASYNSFDYLERNKKFISYWSEHSSKGKKMRFEKETVFDISKRLLTWYKNSDKFENKSNGGKSKLETLKDY